MRTIPSSALPAAIFSLVLGLVVGLTGCAAEATPAPVVASETPARQDGTGLRFLLPPEIGADPTSRAANEALRVAMSRAGYQVASDASGRFDAELVTRTEVKGREISLPISSGRTHDTSEWAHFTVTVVAQNHIVEAVHTDFVALNGEVKPRDVVPAIDAIGRSLKVADLSAKVREERTAREQASARTASR